MDKTTNTGVPILYNELYEKKKLLLPIDGIYFRSRYLGYKADGTAHSGIPILGKEQYDEIRNLL